MGEDQAIKVELGGIAEDITCAHASSAVGVEPGVAIFSWVSCKLEVSGGA
jgi:hypothetical protein